MRRLAFNRISLFILLIIIPLLSLGQESELKIYFESDSVEISEGATFINRLNIQNLHMDSIHVEISGYHMNNALLKLPTGVQIAPFRSLQFPVKFLASKALINEEYQKFKFLIRVNKKGRHVNESQPSFITVLPTKKRLLVLLEQPEFYLLPNDDETKLVFIISNPSLFQEKYSLKLIDLPKGYEIINPAKLFWIDGRSKQEVVLVMKHPIADGKMVDFHCTLELKQDKHDKPLRYKLRGLNLTGQLDLTQNVYAGENPNNNFNEINYLTSDYMNSIPLNSNSEMYFSKDNKLEYSLQFNHFIDHGTFQLFNSQINFMHKNWQFTAGSLHENLNYNLNGKGVKMSYRNDDRTFKALLMDNDLVILGNETDRRVMGYNIGMEYLKGLKTKETTRLLAVYNNRPDLRVENSMVNLEHKLWENNIHLLNLESGISMAHHDSDIRKKYELGFAGGINYSAKFEKVGLQTMQYYSHPNFTGNRRGVIQSEFQLDYNPKSTQGIKLGWTFNQNRIKTNDLQYVEVLKDLLRISQMNVSLDYKNKLSKNFSIGFGPYYLEQYMDRLNVDHIVHNMSESLRFRKSLSYIDKKNGINLILDHGLSNQRVQGKEMDRFYSFRANAMVNHKDLSLHVFYQYNPYFLSDALANLEFGKYHVLNFESRYARYFMKKKLHVANSLMYYYHGDSKHSNYVWNGQILFKMQKGVQLRGDFYFGINRMQRLMLYNPEIGVDPNPIVFNRRDQTLLSTRQIRLGVSKDLAFRGNKDAANLNLLFFHDQNGNGVKDENEVYLNGIIVSTQGMLAQSNKEGKVRFKLIKGETYNFDLQSNSGWIMANNALKQINITRSHNLEVPLVKMTMVKGIITQKIKEFQPKIIDFSDYQILFRTELGVSYQTRSNIHGGFFISLPDGNYKVEIIPRQDFIEVIENGKNVLLKDGKEVRLEFEIVNSSRKINISQF